MIGLEKLLADLHSLQGEIRLDGRHCYRMSKAVVPGVTSVIKVMDAPMLDAWKVRVQVEGTARAAFHNPPPQFDLSAPFYGTEREMEYLAAETEYIERLVRIAKDEFEHERLANEAADVGKQVHALIEHAIKTQLGQPSEAPAVTDAALFAFSGWREWADRVRLEPLMAEGRIHHPSLNYCGTLDLLCLIDGEPAVLDWKASPALYDDRRLQIAAYRKALMYSGWPPLRGAIVCLPRDGSEIQMIPSCSPGPELDASFEAFTALLRVYRWQKEVAKRARERARAAA